MLFLYNVTSTHLIRLLKALEVSEESKLYKKLLYIYAKYVIYKATNYFLILNEGPAAIGKKDFNFW